MKKSKVLLSFLIALFAISFTSCKKDEVKPKVESLIIETDEPPVELFPNANQVGFTYKVYIQPEDLSKKIDRGFGCYNPQYNNECGNWYSFSSKKYFGILKGKIYISKSKFPMVANGDELVKIQDAVARKESAIGTFCLGSGDCGNPFSSYGDRVWLEQ